ncbi:hypothetical protein DOY81_006529, partial [Sarcophaga bullata]
MAIENSSTITATATTTATATNEIFKGTKSSDEIATIRLQQQCQHLKKDFTSATAETTTTTTGCFIAAAT